VAHAVFSSIPGHAIEPPCYAASVEQHAMPANEPVILHQDNHLIAVYKPAGWLSQGDRTGDPNLMDWVKAWLARTYHKPGAVFLGLLHRLDRPVSGVVVFARTSKAASRMSQLFRERRVDKLYRALLEGQVQPEQARLVHYIQKGSHDTDPVRVFAGEHGDAKAAALRYRTLWRSDHASLVEVQLESGRKHQIRAQFAHIGHPIVGDRRYGAAQRFDAPGIGLIAVRLNFEHPVAKQALTIEIPEQLCPQALRLRTLS
jgi:23S rRNA pseudouridine1911/1915/1917 synthase